MMNVDDSDNEWSDISEDETPDTYSVLCLFCENISCSVDQCLSHMVDEHQFQLVDYIRNNITDFYGYIKYINYIRKNKISAASASSLTQNVYSSDEHLIPTVTDDMLLQFDVDSILESNPKQPVSGLAEKLSAVEIRACNAEMALQHALKDLNECKTKLKELFIGSNSSEVMKPKVTDDDSEAYFTSYAHYGIHEEMLKDKIRTTSYQKFITGNPNTFSNANVLDVGCGTSILSMFSAKAGASSVTGVDNSEIAFNAIDIVKENHLDHVIKIVKCKAEDLKVETKFDIIISEWMGYFLIFESMLDTIIYCRDHYLKDGGCVYPDKCNIKLIGLQDIDLVNEKLNYWDNVYGYKMTCMKSEVLKEPQIRLTNPEKTISKPYVVVEFDLMIMKIEELDFDKKFILEITSSGELNAIAGYFDIAFEKNLCSPVKFSTSPFDEATHWKQTIFVLEKSFAVEKGEHINGRIMCKKNKKDNRALDIAIIIYDKTFKNVQLKQFFVLC